VNPFNDQFEALSGFAPYQWQCDLFRSLLSGEFPSLAIPTGLGKTSVMFVWLLALAEQMRSGSAVSLPRRLVYVVDRRTVVDQSTDVAMKIRDWLVDNPGSELARTLTKMSVLGRQGRPPLAISTLRGELADNGAWRVDPTRPAIIVGTVDMIGSRLLFSGYGDGKSRRPMHAGLLGQDALLIHDEAHLSPAFGHLCRQIQSLQRTNPSGVAPGFRLIEMTATPGDDDAPRLPLPDRDRVNPRVVRRLEANKTLTIRMLDESASPADKRDALVQAALGHSDKHRTVLVYVVRPDDAARIAKALQAADKSADVLTLTGTMRGHERDQLVKRPAYRRFLPMADDEREHDRATNPTCYLVSTSAGEVGVDLDADVGVFDLSPMDSFVQRAGRINRTGGRDATIELVVSPEHDLGSKGSMPEILQHTVALLKALPETGGDGSNVSPASLSRLILHPEYQRACRPSPRLRDLEPYLLDTWAMTSRPSDVGPEVAPWLHGVTEQDLPQTVFVWRDWPRRDGEPLGERDYAEWLSAWPILTRERVALPSIVAQKYLGEMHKRLATDARVLVIRPDKAAMFVSLTSLEKNSRVLRHATVILEPSWGGLSKSGMPDAREPAKAGIASLDVSEEDDGLTKQSVGATGRRRERWHLVVSPGDPRQWTATHLSDVMSFEAESLDDAIGSLEERRELRVAWRYAPRVPLDGEDFDALVIYLVSRRPVFPDTEELGAQAARQQALEHHNSRVGEKAREIATCLGLGEEIVDALETGGHAHDRGKDRLVWQHAAGNHDSIPLAKCFGRKANWHLLRGYRHEFGSVMELAMVGSDAKNDLMFQVVAAHHGYARPGFAEEAFDPTRDLSENAEQAYQVMLRFDRLQRRYGWWGLAYLEALLKAADVMGSMEEAS